MLLVSLLLLLLALFLLIFKTRNLYSITFTISLFSLFFLLLFSIAYIERASIYLSVFAIEKPFINIFKFFNFSIFKLRDFSYASISIYFAAMCIVIVKLLTQNKSLKHEIFAGIVAGIVLGVLLFLNSSNFTETLYIEATTSSDSFMHHHAKEIFFIINLTSKIFFVIFSVLPYLLFYFKYKKHQLFYKKKQIIYFCILLFTLQLLIVSTAIGPLKFYFLSSDLLNLYTPPSVTQNTDYYFILTVYTILIIAFTFFVITQYKIFDELEFFKKLKSPKTLKLESNDIKHIFHSFKNNLIVLDMLNQNSINDIDNAKSVIDNLQQSQIYINDMYDHTTRFLNLYKKQNTPKELVLLDELVKNAVSHLKIPSNITVTFDSQDEFIQIFTDKLLFTETIINIIQNAFEAIGTNLNGEIIIRLWKESNFGCLSIKDNGCGIERRHLGKIYKPLFSTKKTHTNWGLGLSYAKKIVNSHYGFINIQSKVSKGTEVQIAIPLE